MVIRGGYGIYYSSQGNGRVSFRLHRQQPYGGTNSENIDAFSNSPRRVADGLRPIPDLDFEAAANRPSGEPLTLVDNFKSGYAQQFNCQIQQEIPSWRTVLKVGYVGNLSRQLQMDYNFNQPFPGPEPPNSRRPLRFIAPDVRDMRYGVSTGHGQLPRPSIQLRAALRQRLRSDDGLHLLAFDRQCTDRTGARRTTS